MEQQIIPCGRRIEHISQPGQKDDGIFQPFAVMDTEDLDGIGMSGKRGGRQVELLLLHPVEIPDEGRQPAEAVLLETPGMLLQKAEVGQLLLPAPADTHDGGQARLFEQAGEQAVYGQGGGEGAVQRHLTDKIPAPLRKIPIFAGGPPPGHPAQRGIKRAAAVEEADAGQVIGGKAVQRGEEDRQQRDVQERVIDDPEQGQRQGNLGCRKETAVPGRGHRDASFGQFGRIDIGTAFFAAQEDTKIPIGGGACNAVFGNRQGAHQLPDPFGDDTGLTGVAAVKGIFIGIGVDQDQFGFISRAAGIGGARHQRLPGPVCDAGGLFGHELAENEIDTVRDLSPASEIVSQRDGGRVGFAGVIRPGVPFPEKKLGHRLAEAVYTLFDVADKKEVFPFSGKRVEQRVLRRVGILIFVDKDFIEPDGELLRERGGQDGAVLTARGEEAEGPMLQVAEIQHPAVFLLFLVPGGKAADKREKGGHQTAQHVQILAALRLVSAQKGGKGSDQGLYIAAQGFDPFFGGLVPAGPRRLERRGPNPGQEKRKGIPIAFRGQGAGQRLVGRLPVRYQCGPVFFRQHGVAVRQADRRGYQGLRVPENPGDMAEHHIRPDSRPERAGGGIGLFLFVEPALRIGVGLDKIVNFFDILRQTAVILAVAQHVRQLEEARLRLGIGFLDDFPHGLVPQQAGFGVLRHPELRGNVEQMEILPDQVGTEAIDRADGCAGEKALLPPQPPVPRMLAHPAGKFGCDPLFHLGRRRFCEGDDQQAVDAHRVFLTGDLVKDTLDQHGRLAGPCRGRYQQRAAVGLDALLLFGCPLPRRHAAVLLMGKNESSPTNHRPTRCRGLPDTYRPDTSARTHPCWERAGRRQRWPHPSKKRGLPESVRSARRCRCGSDTEKAAIWPLWWG